MKTIYVVSSTNTSWNSITGESTEYKNVDKAYLTEDKAKEYCAERNSSPVRYGYYDYESCDLEEG